MSDLIEKVKMLNALIQNNNTLSAMEIFYDENVEMQENEETPRKGKASCINNENQNLKKVKTVECRLLNQAVDEVNYIVFSEWNFNITYLNNEKYALKQVSVQHWLNGLIIKEKFYYKNLFKIR